MPNAKGQVTIGAAVDEALRDRLDERAKKEGRSRNETIVRALLFFLEYAEVEPAAQVSTPKPKKGKGK